MHIHNITKIIMDRINLGTANINKNYLFLLLFIISIIPLLMFSETYENSSLCYNLTQNFMVSGWINSVEKTDNGYKIKVCNEYHDCCKTFYTTEFFMQGEHTTLCGRPYQNVRRC